MMLSRSLRMKTRTIPGSRTRTLINKKKFLCAATTTEVATTASEKMFTDEQYAAAIAKAAAEIKDAKLEVTTTNEEGSDVTATPKTRVFTDEQYEAAIAAAVALKEQQMAVQEATTVVETTTDATATVTATETLVPAVKPEGRVFSDEEYAAAIAVNNQGEDATSSDAPTGRVFTDEQYAAALAAATNPELAGDVASAKQVMFTEEQYAAALAAASDPALAAASAPKPVPVTEAMAFSGPAPETINGRLAMVGFVSAVAAEFSKQETIVQQFGDATNAIIATAITFIVASLIPMLKGDVDKSTTGMFNAKAEQTNGRLAMVGLSLLLVIENVSGKAFF
ncbi:early light-inducible protein [Pycnococcus provasolii]|uniref:Early light-inducible protein n=1 Tax=Pycnococcus provasolii TaxID=41880 RepID=A0A830I470_9CHLO|nr:early light-inducible protein [Pycnococcus provasolii]